MDQQPMRLIHPIAILQPQQLPPLAMQTPEFQEHELPVTVTLKAIVHLTEWLQQCQNVNIGKTLHNKLQVFKIAHQQPSQKLASSLS